jgi:hypothetical protein
LALAVAATSTPAAHAAVGSCNAAGANAAIAAATSKSPSPTAGSISRSGLFDLKALTDNSGAVHWGIDSERMAKRVRSRSGKDRSRMRDCLRVASVVRGKQAITWTHIPGGRTVDIRLQISMARLLIDSGDGAGRSMASKSLGALRLPVAQRSERSLDELASIVLGADAAAASKRVNTTVARRGVNPLVSLASRAVRRTSKGAWGVVGGAWATAAQQRSLAKNSRRLVAAASVSASTIRAARAHARALKAKPIAKYRALPTAAFYPMPADGVRDTQRVNIGIDKPASIVVHIFNSAGSTVATIRGASNPGVWSAVWNGVRADGVQADAGKYRYRVVVIDLVGNRTTLPGLSAFSIARDTTPPNIKLAQVKLLGGVTRRKLRVRWNSIEPLSPIMRVTLEMKLGTTTKSFRVPATTVSGTKIIRMKLGKGTWDATIKLTDGSGNVASSPGGQVVVM